MRALADPRGCVAFDRLVQEFRRATDPQIKAKEEQQAVEIILAKAGHLYTREEVEQIMRHCWGTFRFALANEIGEHFEEE